MINTSRKRFNLIIMLRGRLCGCNPKTPKTLEHTYKTFIRPVLDYHACVTVIMPNHMHQQLFEMERRFLRRTY
jgi:hypothetical protein